MCAEEVLICPDERVGAPRCRGRGFTFVLSLLERIGAQRLIYAGYTITGRNGGRVSACNQTVREKRAPVSLVDAGNTIPGV